MNFYEMKVLVESAPRSVLRGTGPFQDRGLAYTARDEVERQGYAPNDVFVYLAKIADHLNSYSESYREIVDELEEKYGNDSAGIPAQHSFYSSDYASYFYHSVLGIFDYIRSLNGHVRTLSRLRGSPRDEEYLHLIYNIENTFNSIARGCRLIISPFARRIADEPMPGEDDDYGGEGSERAWRHMVWLMSSLQRFARGLLSYLEEVQVEEFMRRAAA